MSKFIRTFCKHCRMEYHIVKGDSRCPYCYEVRRDKFIYRAVVIGSTLLAAIVLVKLS
jgi:hypothetical protein